MTQQEFFAHTQLNPNQVNIWYSNQGAPYTLYAITVPVLDVTSPTPVNNAAQLEVTQQIVLPISTGDVLILDVISRNRVQTPSIPGTIDQPGILSVEYYYFEISPITIQTFGTTSISVNQLQFSPSIDQAIFNASPYNVTNGNIQASRKSTYIMSADRYKVGTTANPTFTGPLNIVQLLSGSATKANVQDSNYSSTPWTNARYLGSKTDSDTFGTNPAISGRPFQGSEFPRQLDIPSIKYLISTNQVVYKDLFYSGTGDTPGFQIRNAYYQVQYTSGNNDEIITITVLPAGRIPRSGELYRQTGGTEIFRVNSIGVLPTGEYVLFTTRGYYGAQQTLSTAANAPLERVTQVQVYNVEGNKLSGVPKGLVYVKETGNVLTLDSLGDVIFSQTVVTP